MQVRNFFIIAAMLSLPEYAAAVDLYGSSSSAQSTALGGLFAGSGAGPTDSLAANPAALAGINRPIFEASALGIFAGGSYQNSTPVPGSLAGSSGFSGSAAFGARLGSSRVHVGLGVFPVSMLSDKWRFLDPIGAGGASYGMQTNKSAFVALQTSAGLAVQVTRKLSLGASLGVLYNSNTLTAPYIFQNNALAGLKTLLDLHTAGTGINGSFGAIYAPSRTLEFGTSYKTRTVVNSTGNAAGDATAQFAALGLPFQTSWRYQAEVTNIFPQSAAAYVRWQATHRLRTHLQADWTNWHDAFVNLPVHLTQGTNPDINSLLQSTSLQDSIPLHWRNQLAWRGGVEYALTESATVMGGYSHVNNPVPSSTLTPLTADIMRSALSTGVTLQHSRYRFAAAYQVNLPTTETVAKSSLLAGEFDNTRTHLWLQTVVLTTGIRF